MGQEVEGDDSQLNLSALWRGRSLHGSEIIERSSG
jgi:hypothetical protein